MDYKNIDFSERKLVRILFALENISKCDKRNEEEKMRDIRFYLSKIIFDYENRCIFEKYPVEERMY